MNQNLCESDRLVAFLEGTLPEQEASTITEHLNECSSCAHELEALAADKTRWHEVKTFLSRSTSPELQPPADEDHSQTMPYSIRQVIRMLEPTDDPDSMGRLGGYEVTGVVGSGAMGVVLKAHDPALDRVVALKVMNPTLAACGTARYRFAREARAAAGVLHPNVIAIHGVSTDRELPFLVMPYIAGTSLQKRLDHQGPLKLVEILRIGSQIAAGLAAAHQKGLIHRDIKPSNVMLDEGVETALITDFGLARLIDDATMTKTGAIAGTPEYMSPEQARGDAIGCASDIFSLGSVLYSLCTGTRPFRAKTSFGVLRKITDEEPASIRDLNPEIPDWLCTQIEQMHSKSPTDRPDAVAVQQRLEACLAHVYQPDRIPLPAGLVDSNPAGTSLFSKPLLTGVFTIMSLIFLAFIVAAMQPDNGMSDGTSKTSIAATSEQKTSNEPTVFRTLNLEFPNPDQKGKLKIDINRGFVEVTGHDQPGVVIEILTPPEYERSSGQDSQFSKVFAPKYDLDIEPEHNLIDLDTYNQDYVLNLRIKVPHETDLSLDAYRSGYITVNGVTGIIDAHSEHSDISLLDISGTATAFSRNGNLKIRFQEVAPNAMLDFESYNGAIDLSMPQSTALTTAVSSGTGSFLTAFDITTIGQNEGPQSILDKVKSNVDEYQFGKINGGGIPLRIENENGKIQIGKTNKLQL